MKSRGSEEGAVAGVERKNEAPNMLGEPLLSKVGAPNKGYCWRCSYALHVLMHSYRHQLCFFPHCFSLKRYLLGDGKRERIEDPEKEERTH
jgi:hypothetical protein